MPNSWLQHWNGLYTVFFALEAGGQSSLRRPGLTAIQDYWRSKDELSTWSVEILPFLQGILRLPRHDLNLTIKNWFTHVQTSCSNLSAQRWTCLTRPDNMSRPQSHATVPKCYYGIVLLRSWSTKDPKFHVQKLDTDWTQKTGQIRATMKVSLATCLLATCQLSWHYKEK